MAELDMLLFHELKKDEDLNRDEDFAGVLVRLLNRHLPRKVNRYSLDTETHKCKNPNVPPLVTLARRVVLTAVQFQNIPTNCKELAFAMLLSKPLVHVLFSDYFDEMITSQKEPAEESLLQD